MELEAYHRICIMDDMSSDFDRLEHARRTAEATYAKFPLDADNLTRWGRVLLELAQFHRCPECKKMVLDDAISKLEEALEVDRRKHDALWALGNGYTSKAAQYYEQAAQLEPSNELYKKSSEVAAKFHKHGFSQQALGPDPSAPTSTKGSPDRYIYRCCKSCARKRQTIYLPQEMVFEFLSHLPAQVLLDVMMHVSNDWNLVVHSRAFTQHHLRNSTSGILIQEWMSPYNAIYVEMRRGCLEISKLDYMFKDVARTSCNGLVLLPDPVEHPPILHVVNPLTKQQTVLPRYLHDTKDHVVFGLAFVEASMEYKVVCVYPEESFCLRTHIYVLTVGVDKAWRSIDIKQLLHRNERDGVHCGPLVTGGYVSWIGESFVLTLNVETEAVCRFLAPQLSGKIGKFLAMGSKLSFVSRNRKCMRDVWEMNPKTGEVTMILRFDLKPVRRRFADSFKVKDMRSVVPICWLVVREVLLYSHGFATRHYVAYNVKTGEIQSIELGSCAKKHHFEAHVNSLVSLEGF
ncbi:uncharacterized protein LOC142516592 isoform X2 [Primulina tabacum]|uniref:uncharacterized protein LOC142516566 isoform X2 n=1 Tax=Primulina tabacum TaxID=48773 RepID=UPI003F59A557